MYFGGFGGLAHEQCGRDVCVGEMPTYSTEYVV